MKVRFIEASNKQQLLKLRDELISEIKRKLSEDREDLEMMIAFYFPKEARDLGVQDRERVLDNARQLDGPDICKRLVSVSKSLLSHLKEIINRVETDENYKTLLTAYEIDFAIYHSFREDLKKKIDKALNYSVSAVDAAPDPESFLDEFEEKLMIPTLVKVYLDGYLTLLKPPKREFADVKKVSRDLLPLVRKYIPDLRVNADNVDKLFQKDLTLSSIREFYELLLWIFEIEEDEYPRVLATRNGPDGKYVCKVNSSTGFVTDHYFSVNLASLNKIEDKKGKLDLLVHEFVHFLQLWNLLGKVDVKTLVRESLLSHGPNFDQAVQLIVDALL